MIPRLKPYLDWQEVFAPFKRTDADVLAFEKAFAKKFNVQHALAFPYGRSALWAFLKTMQIENAEIVQPAYTCSVVAHATVLSGNIPVFVDCTLDDYNMDLEKFADAITDKTQAVIPTHIFGHPMDVDTINQIVRSAEKKFGHKIWVIQDCAHSFNAKWHKNYVMQSGDAALFGLGISKLITSIFGGMFTTNNDALANKLRLFRDQNFIHPGSIKNLRRYLYLLAVYPAFSTPLYGFVYWLQKKTPLLNRLTKAYHLDQKIHFPPDFLNKLTSTEAAVGLVQLKKYDRIINRRLSAAEIYFGLDAYHPVFIFPPKIEGATYSHFSIRTNRKKETMEYFARHGVQLGELIEYSMPHHPAYLKYTQGTKYPNATLCSHSMINLPIHPALSQKQILNIGSTWDKFVNQAGTR